MTALGRDPLLDLLRERLPGRRRPDPRTCDPHIPADDPDGLRCAACNVYLGRLPVIHQGCAVLSFDESREELRERLRRDDVRARIETVYGR